MQSAGGLASGQGRARDRQRRWLLPRSAGPVSTVCCGEGDIGIDTEGTLDASDTGIASCERRGAAAIGRRSTHKLLGGIGAVVQPDPGATGSHREKCSEQEHQHDGEPRWKPVHGFRE